MTPSSGLLYIYFFSHCNILIFFVPHPLPSTLLSFCHSFRPISWPSARSCLKLSLFFFYHFLLYLPPPLHPCFLLLSLPAPSQMKCIYGSSCRKTGSWRRSSNFISKMPAINLSNGLNRIRILHRPIRQGASWGSSGCSLADLEPRQTGWGEDVVTERKRDEGRVEVNQAQRERKEGKAKEEKKPQRVRDNENTGNS